MLLLANGKQQFIDQNGAPLAGGLVYIYQPGTTTPVTTFQDQAGQTANTNPIQLDSRGQAVIWGAGTFRQVVRDVAGNLIWDQLVAAPDVLGLVNQSAAGVLAQVGASSGATLVGFQQAGASGETRTVHDKLSDMKSLADFGAVGDGVTDDTTAVQAALAAAGKNTGVLMVGTAGTRFRVSAISIPDFVSLFGSGRTFGMTDIYDSTAFGTCGATLLLNAGATVTMGNGSSLCNAHLFPYGMVFPQSSSSAWTGTAITVNRGVQKNTVDVLLENLLICGFGFAVDGYWCPRLICNNVNFDCNNGIRVVTAGDPIRFFNCHGWPFATIAGTITTDAGARDRRSGSGFAFSTNADAGKITNCFAFGYAVGFDINAANGITFLSCGSDDYNLITPLNSIGWRIMGSCGLTVLTSCQSVAHLYGLAMNAADDTNIVQVNGGLFGSNSTDNFHLQVGSLVVRGTAIGAAQRAVGMYGATNRLQMGGCVLQGITNEVVLNSASSPHVYIGADNLTQDITVPMYNGPAIDNVVASGASVALPLSGDNILVTGTTNVFGFTGGWPGRVVHLRFNGALVVSDSATLQIAGNFSSSTNSVLTLRFTSATQCYEVSRSIN